VVPEDSGGGVQTPVASPLNWYAFTWNKLQDNFFGGRASNFTKDSVGCPTETSRGDS